jgi:hypothetical protein
MVGACLEQFSCPNWWIDVAISSDIYYMYYKSRKDKLVDGKLGYGHFQKGSNGSIFIEIRCFLILTQVTDIKGRDSLVLCYWDGVQCIASTVGLDIVVNLCPIYFDAGLNFDWLRLIQPFKQFNLSQIDLLRCIKDWLAVIYNFAALIHFKSFSLDVGNREELVAEVSIKSFLPTIRLKLLYEVKP